MARAQGKAARAEFGLSRQLNHLDCFPFQEVIRNLVKRYVAAMIRTSKTNEGLTEENFKVIYYSSVIICFINSNGPLQSLHSLVKVI